jgi:magnesium transporter
MTIPIGAPSDGNPNPGAGPAEAIGSAQVATCVVYRNGALVEERSGHEHVGELLREPGAMVWLDLEDPSEEELRALDRELSLHPLWMEDTLHRDQRAKVEVDRDNVFVVLHAMRRERDELVDAEIHAFAGPGYLVTLRYPPSFDMAAVRRRWEKQPAEFTAQGGGALLYTLLDEVVDGYFDIVEWMEEIGEGIEEAVFAAEPAPDVQERVFLMKKRVLQFRRRVMPLREVLDLLQEEVDIVSDRLRPYFRDIADHVLRVLEFIDSVRDLLTTALEAHLAQVSNRVNQVVKQVTSWAAIILVPTLIAGVYGMNFVRPFPDFGNPWGFWVAIGVMLGSGLGLAWYFRRRGWL